MDEIIAACMSYEGSINELQDFVETDKPVYILGIEYSTKNGFENIRSDVCTRIWMSYRRNFPEIIGTELTSDKGWGCMLRCGQMVLAESLIRYHLGREWRWHPEEQNETYKKILSLFIDDSAQPFSIHNIAKTGVNFQKQIGEWYGPNTVAQVIKKICPVNEFSCIKAEVAMDNVFIINELRQSTLNVDTKIFQPILIFVPLRLGVREVNPMYIPGLKKCLKMPQSLGIIGGRPNQALYFIGFVGDEIIYLDPHTTQESGSESNEDKLDSKEFDLSCHCFHSQRLAFEQLDPSIALTIVIEDNPIYVVYCAHFGGHQKSLPILVPECFFCSNEKEYGDLCNRLQQEIVDGEANPLFEIHATRPAYLVDDFTADTEGATGFDFEDHQCYSDDDDFEILQ